MRAGRGTLVADERQRYVHMQHPEGLNQPTRLVDIHLRCQLLEIEFAAVHGKLHCTPQYTIQK